MSKFSFGVVSELAAKKIKHDNGNNKHKAHWQVFNSSKLRKKSPNNWVNQTAGSSVALVAA